MAMGFYGGGNYPAMTREQWERAPFNEPTNDDMEFESTSCYTLTVNTTITTDDWYDDGECAVINDSNAKTPDITPEDFVLYAIGALEEKAKTANEKDLRTIKDMIAYAKNMTFEHEGNDVEDIKLDKFDEGYIAEVRYEMERERMLLGD